MSNIEKWLAACLKFAKPNPQVFKPQLITYSGPNLIDCAQHCSDT